MHVRDARLRRGPARTPTWRPALAAAPGALSRYQVAADPRFAALGPAGRSAPSRPSTRRWWCRSASRTRLRGLLLLGPKRSEAAYTAEDLEAARDAGRPGGGGGGQREAHRQVLDYARRARAEPADPHEPRQVRAPARARADRGVAGGAARSRSGRPTSPCSSPTSPATRGCRPRLAPDALDALVERYFGAFLDEIVKHGGDVNETAGDGLMVIFHEGDHARAAVATAARHPRAAPASSTPSWRRAPSPLAMHVGVNTGPRAPRRDQDRGPRGHALDLHRLRPHHQHRGPARRAGPAAASSCVSEETRARLGDDVRRRGPRRPAAQERGAPGPRVCRLLHSAAP